MRTLQIRPLRRVDTRTRLLTAAVVGCYAALPAFAQLPSGMSVQSGSATATQSGNVLTVANSNGAILHWDSFSIGKGYTTYFQQASASSSVLNRVVGASPSQIYGTLSSNGRVWLINPNGILIGPGGMVNTAGFVASTLDVSNANFLAGKLTFDKTAGAAGVVNQGTVTTPSGGSVYLVGASVSNEGIITTPQGEAILAAGETVDLIDTGTPGVKVTITGAAGNATNLGTVLADAGRIGMAGVMVRNSGTLNASSVVKEGGRIFLKASQDTYVDGAGRIVATGTKGGRVEVLGNRVALTDQATIDVSGQGGGGTVLVGGDFQGKNAAIQNAQMAYFGPQAVIKADATENGSGGTVVVWSDDTTRAYGTITARGGVNGGDGGLVETSGKRALEAWARVSTAAPKGRTGSFLLDPVDITIDSSTLANYGPGSTDYGGTPLFVHDTYPGSTAAISWYYLKDSLANTDVIIQTKTSTASPGNGDITFTGAMSYNQAHSLTLLAQRNLNFTTGSIQNSGAGSISLVAGWD
ncbi:MAG TPA: filamentous hemagglutinin N-terminal domain-containing protein, partial [Rhodocyclaceae bacterium]